MNLNNALLKPGPRWESFEELRSKHAENLERIAPGTAATLRVKKKTYYILNEDDLERVQSMVRSIGQLEGMLELLKTAMRLAKHIPQPPQHEDIFVMLEQTIERTERDLEQTLGQLKASEAHA